MTNEQNLYGMPNMGCMLGTAYQALVSELSSALSASGADISVPEYLILRALYTRDGMQQCEIGAIISKDKGAISRCVASMERKGLVRTEAVSHKCLKVYLAEKGRKLEPKISSVAQERHSALESMLTPDEMTTFATVLRKIIQQHNK